MGTTSEGSRIFPCWPGEHGSQAFCQRKGKFFCMGIYIKLAALSYIRLNNELFVTASEATNSHYNCCSLWI